jgi:hypothetical protein
VLLCASAVPALAGPSDFTRGFAGGVADAR